MNEAPSSKFIREDIDFLKSLNETPTVESNIYFTAKHSGYMRSLDQGTLQHLENTYKRTINPAFVLCFHCSSDVMAMVLELYGEFEKDQAASGEATAPDAPQDDMNATGAIDQPDPEIPGNLLHQLTETDVDGLDPDSPFGVGDLITYPAGTDWRENKPVCSYDAARRQAYRPGDLRHKVTEADIAGPLAGSYLRVGDLILYPAGTDWKEGVVNSRKDKDDAADTTSTTANEGEQAEGDPIDPELPGNRVHIVTDADSEIIAGAYEIKTGDRLLYPSHMPWADALQNILESAKAGGGTVVVKDSTHIADAETGAGDIPPVTLGETADGKPITETVSVETEPPAPNTTTKKTRTKKADK